MVPFMSYTLTGRYTQDKGSHQALAIPKICDVHTEETET
jgi:hypothetical protein